MIHTTRFGSLEISNTDIIEFPAGLIGLEDCREWILLADASTDSLAWMQSVARSEIAMAVVSPRRFVADYQVKLSRAELNCINLEDLHDVFLLAIVGKNDHSLTLNLKAPLLFNLSKRLGRQVVTNEDQPLQYEIAPFDNSIRLSA